MLASNPVKQYNKESTISCDKAVLSLADTNHSFITFSVPRQEIPIQCIWDGVIYSSFRLQCAPSEGHLLVFVRSGEGSLRSQNSVHPLSPGSLIFLDRAQSVILDVIQPVFSAVCFLLSSSEADIAYAAYSRDEISVISCGKNSELPEFVARMLRLLTEISGSSQTARSAVVSDLFEELASCKSFEHESPALTSLYISSMKQIFEQRYSEKLSLGIVSKELHINKYKLAKEFKFYYDVSPIEYLISIRIEAAKRLLIGSRKTITQIGIDIAIENTPYFVRLFKTHTGLTPLKYRLKHQKVLPLD